jgi:hypothetical protein
LWTGRYGEHWSRKPYRLMKEDERAEKRMETGLKMVADMGIDTNGSYGMIKAEKKRKLCIWGLMGHARIEVAERPGEERGWRE